MIDRPDGGPISANEVLASGSSMCNSCQEREHLMGEAISSRIRKVLAGGFVASILALGAGVGVALAHDHTHGPTTTTGGACTKTGKHYQNTPSFPVLYALTTAVSGCNGVQAKLCYYDPVTLDFDLNITTTGGTPAYAEPDHFGHVFYSDHNGLSGATWYGFRLSDHAGC